MTSNMSRAPKESSRTRSGRDSKATPLPRIESARAVLKQFRVLFSSIKTHYRDIESRCGVSGSQLWALAEIQRAAGISVSELALTLLVHQSTASNLLEGLERLALVTKVRSKQDQRIVRLRITAKGRSVLSRAPGPAVGVLLDALQQLPEDSLQGLATGMHTLACLMQRRDEDAAAKPLADI